MKAVGFFNNKGGVGKTTLLSNLAAYLALHRSRRVLVVDADPQCNATQAVFTEEYLLDFYSKKHDTLYSFVRPIASGKGFASDVNWERASRHGYDIVAGHPSMALMEDTLAQDWSDAQGGNPRGLRTTLVFAKLLEHCAQYDYVFFDMGPSLGAINRSVLLSCDYFITPMSIDIFSLQGIENIGMRLASWKRDFTLGLDKLPEDEDIEIANPEWHLQFLGYVNQQYKAKTVGGQRRPVSAYEKILDRVPDAISKHLLANLGDSRDSEDCLLGSIPLLHSLLPLSQSARAPIFALGSEHGVRGAHFARVDDFRVIIDGIAERFEAIVQRLSQ